MGFSEFIRERQFLSNVSPSTLEWYKHSFKWLDTEAPTQEDLRAAVLKMRAKGRLALGIPKESLWAYDPSGLNQIGCVYTAQGFEFDYVGVIFGTDLVYLPESASWTGDRTKSFDTVVKRSGDRFRQMVQNTYRVLLTRGMKGCYVTFMDKNTEHFFRSRMEGTNVLA